MASRHRRGESRCITFAKAEAKERASLAELGIACNPAPLLYLLIHAGVLPASATLLSGIKRRHLKARRSRSSKKEKKGKIKKVKQNSQANEGPYLQQPLQFHRHTSFFTALPHCTGREGLPRVISTPRNPETLPSELRGVLGKSKGKKHD